MTVQHRDIPDAQLHQVKGAAAASAGQILVATGTGSATFQNPSFTSAAVGFWDYNDTATVSTPILLTLANTEYQLTNNGLGANTLKTYRLPSITEIFNTSTNYFQFTGLQLGDVVDIRADIEIVTTSANNVVDMLVEFGIGSSPYKITFDQRYFKTAGTHKVTVPISFYLGNSLTLNNPARILVKNDSTGASVRVNGWYARVITNG
jgi:hypothetical protein